MKIAMFVLGMGVAAAFALFALPYLGLFPFGAVGGPNIIDWWGDTNYMAALSRASPSGEEEVERPGIASPPEGFQHYRESCVLCHGAPDVAALEWTEHMQPQPPHLWDEDSQALNDGELFLVIRDGIRMTGMPAFGPEHEDEAIWDIVAYLRTLNRISDAEKQVLTEAVGRHEMEGHHEGDMDHEEMDHGDGEKGKMKAGEKETMKK